MESAISVTKHLSKLMNEEVSANSNQRNLEIIDAMKKSSYYHVLSAPKVD